MVEITLPIVLQIVQTVALIVGIIYYLSIMRNQQRTRELALKAQEQALETRQAQMFMGIFNQMNSDGFIEAWEYCRSLDFTNFEEYLKIRDELDWRKLRRLGVFFEGLGTLVKENLVNIRLVALMMSSMVKQYWEPIEEMTFKAREYDNYPRFNSEVEYLYRTLMKYLEEHPELARARKVT
jgi:hypothetical protein